MNLLVDLFLEFVARVFGEVAFHWISSRPWGLQFLLCSAFVLVVFLLSVLLVMCAYVLIAAAGN